MLIIKDTETMPPQKQQFPGSEQRMHPRPISDDPGYKGTGQLKDKIALITVLGPMIAFAN